jgi:hypothetical protein
LAPTAMRHVPPAPCLPSSISRDLRVQEDVVAHVVVVHGLAHVLHQIVHVWCLHLGCFDARCVDG